MVGGKQTDNVENSATDLSSSCDDWLTSWSCGEKFLRLLGLALRINFWVLKLLKVSCQCNPLISPASNRVLCAAQLRLAENLCLRIFRKTMECTTISGHGYLRSKHECCISPVANGGTRFNAQEIARYSDSKRTETLCPWQRQLVLYFAFQPHIFCSGRRK